MKFRLNDKVSVLDDDLSGHVIEISGNTITIETTSGFEMSFEASELVHVGGHLLNKSSFSGQSIQNILSEKTSKKRMQPQKNKSKTRQQPPMEVDLHIHQLISSTKGMQNCDMLNLQLDTAS